MEKENGMVISGGDDGAETQWKVENQEVVVANGDDMLARISLFCYTRLWKVSILTKTAFPCWLAVVFFYACLILNVSRISHWV